LADMFSAESQSCFSGACGSGWKSVSTKPEYTTETLIPSFRTSLRRAPENASCANFEEQYSAPPSKTRLATSDAILIIWPDPAFLIGASAALQNRKVPLTLVSYRSDQVSPL